MTDFTGFPKEGLQFLSDLTANNHRDWFEAHKPDFQNHIQKPAQAFVTALGERLQTISPNIRYDTKLSGSGSIMRIYRDVRFSADKTPYKTHIGIVFWEGEGKKTENPGFFIGFDAGGAKVYAGMGGFPKEMLTAYRDAVVDDTLGSELENIVADIRALDGYEVSGEHYKRVPRGYDKDHPRANLLLNNTLGAMSPQMSANHVTTADFVDRCLDHCQKMSPLQQWLVKIAP
ncbi:MAG: DUF2461 domain-containing protein [Chloroflexota bacterium]